MALNSTDLFAVQRGAITYKTPFSDIQNFVTDQLKATWLPNHLDSPSGVGTSTWNGTADTLTATGSIEISIAGGAFGTGGPVASSNQIQARWKPADITNAAHGATLTGRVSNGVGNVAVNYTAVVDKLPALITINAKTNVNSTAAADSDSSSAVSGLNAPARLWLRTTDGTAAQVSIAGGAWTALPTTPATGLAIDQGQTFKLRHTTQAGASTVTTTSVLVGWDVTNSVQVDFATTNVATKAPVINTVTLSDSPQPGRFTSGTFATAVTMTDDGVPASAKGVKAYVEGTLKSAAQTSAITKVDTVTGPSYSSTLTGSGTFTNAAGAFDGTTTGKANMTGVSGLGTITWNAAGYGIAGVTSLRIYSFSGDDGPGDAVSVSVNGGPATKVISLGASNYADGWYNATSLVTGGTVNSIVWTRPNLSPAWNTPVFAIEVNGTILKDGTSQTKLTLTDSTNLANFAAGDAITEVTAAGAAGDATGTVGAVDATAKTITLSPTAGTWDVGSSVKGPLKAPVGGATTRLYCKLDATLNVTDLQSADPGFTTAAGASPYTVTFPATLPTGNAPDVDIPAGATITTEVQASNTAGTVSKTSNTVTPA